MMGSTRYRGSPWPAALATVVLLISGCAHHKHTASRPPQTAPDLEQAQPARPAAPATGAGNTSGTGNPSNTGKTSSAGSATGRIPITPMPPGGIPKEDIRYVNSHEPILSEVGLATWYTAPYKGRKAANGEVFDDAAFTAAHRTLPMGSLVVVTNLNTGQWAAMRISDRGPFVDGRIVDLTVASAKATGVYRAGVVKVRLDVYQTPKPVASGGRWCVQIGAFRSERGAIRLKSELLER